ncbi:hypothetical protein RADP37_05318 [Roseomonas mucosa]|uniref:Uncharacterized protein n=1 Tax=Roseomonas mucosa TaxID=207340 RepID=A0A4Y1MVH9_9PROT|nr:hypothetical protein RADP37_05318 [Roseomonas mucosa]
MLSGAIWRQCEPTDGRSRSHRLLADGGYGGRRSLSPGQRHNGGPFRHELRRLYPGKWQATGQGPWRTVSSGTSAEQRGN